MPHMFNFVSCCIRVGEEEEGLKIRRLMLEESLGKLGIENHDEALLLKEKYC